GERPWTSAPPASRPAAVSMDAASLPPRAPGRRSLRRREDTPPGSRAPRSTTSGHTSDHILVGPRTILDVLAGMDNSPGPWLAYCECSHDPSTAEIPPERVTASSSPST